MWEEELQPSRWCLACRAVTDTVSCCFVYIPHRLKNMFKADGPHHSTLGEAVTTKLFVFFLFSNSHTHTTSYYDQALICSNNKVWHRSCHTHGR